MKKAIYAVLGFVVLAGGAWGVLASVGLDKLAPVQRGEYEFHVAGSVSESVDNMIRWEGAYQQQLLESEVRAEEWQARNPGKPVPEVYRKQRLGIIQQLDAISRSIEGKKQEK